MFLLSGVALTHSSFPIPVMEIQAARNQMAARKTRHAQGRRKAILHLHLQATGYSCFLADKSSAGWHEMHLS